jgi:NADPH:quinone reductase-like Zn-dependent oxidoreductase
MRTHPGRPAGRAGRPGRSYGRSVRAIAFDTYGDADVLTLRDDAPDPLVGPDSVLVRAHAAGVNPVDCKIRMGYLKRAFPSFLPIVPGWDVAGVVEKVGPAVTEFTEGDEVIGYVRLDHIQQGTYAEYVSAPVRALARRPSTVDLTHAAALPLAGLTAHQALDAAGVGPRDTVLVHASAGGVGFLAAQLAVARGARVIGTAREGNHEFLRGFGVDPVAYGKGLDERIRALAPDGVDAALDFVGREALGVSATLVTDATRIVSVVDAAMVRGLGGRYVFVRPDPVMLQRLSDLVDSGTLHIELAETFPLERAVDAHLKIEGGHVRGKLAITID